MKNPKTALLGLARKNLTQAKSLWPQSTDQMMTSLRELTITFGFSVASGDIKIIEGRWYVTHAGLLSLAARRSCIGIHAEPVVELSNSTLGRWVFKAVVQKSSKSRGFVGFGDAEPSNVSDVVRGAEMRVAETRAVNRALRKAYGIGLCSVEELGWSARDSGPGEPNHGSSTGGNGNGHAHGQPRLRDQLSLLIRQHRLDPNLVKAYAAHFCGTESLKDATRDLVQSFVSHLAASATDDRDGLICKLNSFASPVEVQP